MIVPMKKVSILCLATEKDEALKRIRDLGVLHVEEAPAAPSSDREELQRLADNVEKVRYALVARKVSTDSSAKNNSSSGKQIFAEADKLLDKLTTLDKSLETLLRVRETLSPWGDFSPELIRQLREQNIFVYLCVTSEKEFTAFTQRDDLICQRISTQKNKVYFALIAKTELAEKELPEVTPPNDSRLGEVVTQITDTRQQRESINRRLNELATHLPDVENYLQQLTGKVEFLTNRDRMQDHQEITYLKGYIPEHEVKNLSQAATKHGWALLIEKVTPADQPPTLVKIPKFFRFIQPLFEFLGITPGYREIDVSIGILFFFVIYFGMILGDAGYGMLFLLATLIARFKLKGDKFKLPLRLLMVLSIATVVWGGLSGNWFGITLPGIPWLTDPAVKDQNIQFFCFLLAVAQLSLGHLWRAIIAGKTRKVLGQVGWALLLWGNFFLTLELVVYRTGIFPSFMYWFYGIGLAMIVSCDINWLEPSEAFNFPFSLIGSFVDMLSYIRLFAVGMAGYYIASSFNNMVGSMINSSSGVWLVVAVILGIVILLLGHLLNIALCMMGVLVHGVRLNVLEFSNHIGLTWSGVDFKPFKNKEVETKNSK